MRISRRTYWSFLLALGVMAFAAGQLWGLAIGLRQGGVGGGQIALGVVSVPLLIASSLGVLRIVCVAAWTGARRQ